MKVYQSLLVSCVVLLSISPCRIVAFERDLLQEERFMSSQSSSSMQCSGGVCTGTSSVQSNNDDAYSQTISRALATAVARANKGANTTTSVAAFARSVARVCARVISGNVIVTFNNARGSACAQTRPAAGSYANTMKRVTSSAFKKSPNSFAKAAAPCLSKAISTATSKAVRSSKFRVCGIINPAVVTDELESVGYVKDVVASFSTVFAAIKNKNAKKATQC